MKLLDITEFHSPVGGGVTSYLQAKAQWLAGQPGVEHVIVLSSASDGVEQWHRSRVYHVAGPRVPASPGFYFLLGAGRVRDILQRERPDVVELGSPFLAPWLVRRAARGLDPVLVGYFHDDLPAVWVDHGLAGAPSLVRAVARALVGWYVRAVYRRLAHTVAPTPAGAATLSRLGIRGVSMVPLGVDTERFHPRQRDPSWKAEVGATDGTPVALYVGRLAREKELALLLTALPRLAADYGIKLVLIGEGHMRARLQALACERPGQLTVLPFEADRSRLARAYASADLFVNPCPWETFGLATVEAMASGLPVVAAAAGGSAELLRAGGGVTFAPKDAGDLVRAVGELLHADRTALGAEARRIAESLSWDRAFARQLALYTQLAGAHAAGAVARPRRVHRDQPNSRAPSRASKPVV
jgi:alpha-1,6-mannosyltransferase